jgi:hypothetical protein
MNDKSPSVTIHAALEQTNDFGGDPNLDGSVLLGWVCVMEWAAPDGETYFAYNSADASGEEHLPVWREDGLLHHALHYPSVRRSDSQE